MANLLCGCPSLPLLLGLVAMAMRVRTSVELGKRMKKCVRKDHQILTENQYTSTSLRLQAKTVYQIRMRDRELV